MSKSKTNIGGVSGLGSSGFNYDVGINFTPSGTNSLEGDIEAKPNNITVKCWKRIS